MGVHCVIVTQPFDDKQCLVQSMEFTTKNSKFLQFASIIILQIHTFYWQCCTIHMEINTKSQQPCRKYVYHSM